MPWLPPPQPENVNAELEARVAQNEERIKRLKRRLEYHEIVLGITPPPNGEVEENDD